MTDMDTFYQRFCSETLDKNGLLTEFSLKAPDTFNFAYDVLDEIARIDPGRQALVWCSDSSEEQIFTFADMKSWSDRCAQMLASRGIIKGDKVLLALKRHYSFWFTILALHKLGAVAIPVPSTLTASDYLSRFQSAEVTACVVAGDTIASEIDEACNSYSALRAKFLVQADRPGWISYEKEIQNCNGGFSRVPTVITDPLLLYFTLGTTGQPKMVIHDHSYPLSHIITARYWHNSHAGDLHFTLAETGWMQAFWGKLYGEWMVGAGIFAYDFETFSPENLLKKMRDYKINTFCAPPTVYRLLLEEEFSQYDLSALRYCTAFGDALTPEVSKKWKACTGLYLMEGYGQTESALLTANFVNTASAPGSMGLPSPQYTLRLIDEDGMDVPKGAVGELCVKITKPCYGLFLGYYKDDDATSAVCYDGFYHTGDMAWMDEEGYLWYIGRKEDLIRSAGYRFGPIEIESVLLSHPVVLECAVTGIPHPSWGMVVKATIVLVKGVSPSDELIKELQVHVKKQIAPYKLPRVITFVNELPKTISGKIRRSAIREKDTAN